LRDEYRLATGHGATLSDGGDGVIFAYGPVMLAEALSASELLRGYGFGLKVVNMPMA
jgi:transketolase